MKRITVLLADDNRMVRDEFRKILELEDDLEPVGIQPQVTAATLHVALAIPEDEAERRVSSGQV